MYVELANGLPMACHWLGCIASGGLLRLAWQQLDTYIMDMDLGAGWLHTSTAVPVATSVQYSRSVYGSAVRGHAHAHGRAARG